MIEFFFITFLIKNELRIAIAIFVGWFVKLIKWKWQKDNENLRPQSDTFGINCDFFHVVVGLRAREYFCHLWGLLDCNQITIFRVKCTISVTMSVNKRHSSSHNPFFFSFIRSARSLHLGPQILTRSCDSICF